jgi:hypothetical protein
VQFFIISPLSFRAENKSGSKNACQGNVAWTHFVAEIYEFFDIDTHHLCCFTKLKQSGTVEDFIFSFENLDFRMESMSDAFLENDLSVS